MRVRKAHDAAQRGEAKARQGKAVIFQPLLGRGAPAETGRGENLFDSPLRALIHSLAYTPSCHLLSLPSSTLPPQPPLTLTYTLSPPPSHPSPRLSLFLDPVVPPFVAFFEAHRRKLQRCLRIFSYHYIFRIAI